MKRLLITLSALGCLFADIDLVGNWKLAGLKVDYMHIARETTDVDVCAAVNPALCVTLQTVPAGVVFNTFQNGPFTLDIIDAENLNLNVNLWPDGTGYIAEGSYYPDIDLLPGTCQTVPQIFPVTDEFVWELGAAGTWSSANVLGQASANDLAGGGQEVYGFGVSQSGVFDGWPSSALPERIPPGLDYVAQADGTVLALGCGAWCFGTDGTDGGAAAAFGGDVTACAVACASFDAATAAAYGSPGWLSGSGSSGAISTMGTDPVNSQMPQTLEVDLMLEWNAIDGATSQSGIETEEDDDEYALGDIDRIFGIPYISSTYVVNSPECDITGGSGLTAPLVGDTVVELGKVICSGLSGGATDDCAALGSSNEAALAGYITSGCLDTVTGQVVGLCEQAGGAPNAVAGLCAGAATGDANENGVADVQESCEAYGVDAAVGGACQALGFSAEICATAGGVASSGIADACQSGVEAGALAACDGAGGLWNTLYGGCLQAGGDEATCAGSADAGVAGYGDCATWASVTYADATCADAGTSDCAVLVSSDFVAEMCGFIGATLTCSDAPEGQDCTCDYWASTVADGFGAQSASTGYQTCSDYGANYIGDCITSYDATTGSYAAPATSMYVLDPGLTTWGMFLTANGATVQGLLGNGFSLEDIAALPASETLPGGGASLFANDSNHDFDPTTGTGRLVMDFTPTCVPELEARQIVAEFVGLDDLCPANGDANGDGITNVVDIVRIVAHVLGSDTLGPALEDVNGDGVINSLDGTGPADGLPDLLGGYAACQSDLNADGIINVVDIVGIVSIVLGTKEASTDATEATVKLANNVVSVEADGFVGGVQMLVEHDGELEVQFSDNYYVGGMELKENNTALIVFAGKTNVEDVFTVTQGRVTSILETTVSGSNEILNVTIEQPADYIVGNAYPNPFNPSTTISVELNTSSDLSVKVYNLMGQLVDVIAEGSYSPNTYNWTWNAESLASGVYFVKTQVGSDVSTQKVMLLK